MVFFLINIFLADQVVTWAYPFFPAPYVSQPFDCNVTFLTGNLVAVVDHFVAIANEFVDLSNIFAADCLLSALRDLHYGAWRPGVFS